MNGLVLAAAATTLLSACVPPQAGATRDAIIYLQEDGSFRFEGQILSAAEIKRRVGHRPAGLIAPESATYDQITTAFRQLDGLSFGTIASGPGATH